LNFRDQVCWANRMLPIQGLVTMHSGNVSAIDRESGTVWIKPSGFNYDNLTPADIVEVDFATGQSKGLKPSVDLGHHLFLYRNLPEINAVVHTHSNHATAFAALGMAIPCCLTAIADEFGGPIPCAPYADNENDALGRSILAARTAAPAILLQNHGVMAWGPNVEAALKAAVMVEDVARTVWLAMQLGKPLALPDEEIAKWNDRYQNRYGQ